MGSGGLVGYLVNMPAHHRERKEALADEERRNQVSELYVKGTALAKTINALQKDDPQREKMMGDLTDIERNIHQAYHPARNPGALQRDWHWLAGLIHKHSPAPAALTETITPATDSTTFTFPGQTDPITLAATPRETTVSANQTAMTPQQRQAMAGEEEARKQAELDVEAAGLTPEQAASAALRTTQAEIENDLALFDKYYPNAPKEHREAYARMLLESKTGIKAAAQGTKWVTKTGTINGEKVAVMYDEKDPDAKLRYMNGAPVPDDLAPKFVPDATKLMKPEKGDVVPYAGSKTKYARVYLDPMTKKIVAWAPALPSSRIIGTTTTRTTKDKFGIASTTTGTTQPMVGGSVDLSSVTQMDESYNGEEIPVNAVSSPSDPTTQAAPLPTATAPAGQAQPTAAPGAPPRASTARPRATTPAPHASHAPAATPAAAPKQLQAQVPNVPRGSGPGYYGAPRLLDENNQIPEGDLDLDGKPINPGLREAANELLDGMDIKELKMPSGDVEYAARLARLYGWKRGAYTPRELIALQNAEQFLDSVANSKPFMALLDSGFWKRNQAAFAEKDPSKAGVSATVLHQLAVITGGTDQQEYLRLNQAMTGTIGGLSSVVRPGRPTEATISRLKLEIPGVMESANSADAKERIKNIKREINLALQPGASASMLKQKSVEHNLVDMLDQYLNAPDGGEQKIVKGTVIHNQATGKSYTYKGTGDTNDLSNYDEVPSAPASH